MPVVSSGLRRALAVGDPTVTRFDGRTRHLTLRVRLRSASRTRLWVPRTILLPLSRSKAPLGPARPTLRPTRSPRRSVRRCARPLGTPLRSASSPTDSPRASSSRRSVEPLSSTSLLPPGPAAAPPDERSDGSNGPGSCASSEAPAPFASSLRARRSPPSSRLKPFVRVHARGRRNAEPHGPNESKRGVVTSPWRRNVGRRTDGPSESHWLG